MTNQYYKLESGPMDEIDAAIWSGDTFHNRTNIAEFRKILARWEQGLQSCEDILNEVPESERTN